MSYYDNPQWSAPSQTPNNNNWDHHGATTPVRAGTLRAPSVSLSIPGAATDFLMPTGANGPQPQDDYAFSYQFDGMCGAGEWNPITSKIQRLLLEIVLLLFAAHYKAPRAAAMDPHEIWPYDSNNTLTTISDHFNFPPSLENWHNSGG